MKVPHPIPYQGSKRNLATAILEYFPRHIATLVEPFAGSAAITLAAAARGLAERYVIADLNQPLVDLWRAIIESPAKLARQYETLWLAQHDDRRQYYDKVRQEFNQTGRPDRFLYLLARCVKASVRYNAAGQFNQSPDNRRMGALPETMRLQILAASTLLRGKTVCLASDYKEIAAQTTSDDLLYLDPPYQGVCGERDPRYLQGVLFDEFVEVLETLNYRGIRYLVSYDGRTGQRVHGRKLPDCLRLHHVELHAGRSSQATLLGRDRTHHRVALPVTGAGGILESHPTLSARCREAVGIVGRESQIEMKLPPSFLKLCKAVKAKRPRTVIAHILKHGSITTQELKDKYGYNHPPRAVRDVKEHGIPIEMFRVEGSDGRKIAAYRFGDPTKARFASQVGRTVLGKELKQLLIHAHGQRCAIYMAPFPERELQIDHRVPFEVFGDVRGAETSMDDYMLLCGSANRAKSWSCEHRVNWLELKKPEICRNCYWAFPGNYTHVAMRQIRRADILWTESEVDIYERLKQQTVELQKNIPGYVKEIIEQHLRKQSDALNPEQ